MIIIHTDHTNRHTMTGTEYFQMVSDNLLVGKGRFQLDWYCTIPANFWLNISVLVKDADKLITTPCIYIIWSCEIFLHRRNSNCVGLK